MALLPYSSGGVIPLTVARGGTGTTTAFTLGSVIFAGDSGVYTQNNANFFWDNTNARLGTGTTSPVRALHVHTASGQSRIRVSTQDLSTFQALEFYEQLTFVATIGYNKIGGADRLEFYTSGDSSVPRMSITGAGNVGIGTTSPSRLLHVAGRYQLGGAAIATTDWALTSGWGANATISAVTGTDSRGTVTVTTSALDTPSANPVITLTFKDGTWTTTPFIMANMQHASTGPSTVPATCQATPTTLVISYRGTPTATTALTYIFNYFVVG